MLEADLTRAEQAYRDHLGDLAPWAGSFAVFASGRLVGIFSTFDVADGARQSLHDPDSAVIRQIDCEPSATVPSIPHDGFGWLRIGRYPVYQLPPGQRYAA